MKLLAVDIQGFKSFAKRTHVSFRSGITGVIGPNGSGKSNIAEAIRWVLGEQSSKALRAKERSDVIFVGDSARASKATVTLTFSNESGKFPVASSEIAITRSLTLQGESEYLVNNEPIRLIDLQQMLAEAGIGTKGYTVISQGAVDRYLNATPQGRKELFDEATGIKSLQIKVGLSRQKLEKTTRHAEEVRAIVTELSPKVAFLKRQVDRYSLKETYEQQFRIQQEAWYHHAWHSAAKEIERLEAEQRIVASRIREVREKYSHKEQAALSILQTLQAHESETAAYATWQKEHEYVSHLLQTTTEQLKKAEELLAQEDIPQLPQGDFATSARSLFRQCQQLVSALLRKDSWSKEKLEKLETSIQKLLAADKTIASSKYASLTQEVARLSAIQEEQARQLHRLVEPKKPTSNEENHEISREQLTRDLQAYREEEIAVQREDSAISSAKEQLQADFALLEQEILRECGTATLTKITSSLPDTTTAPSDQLLRTLSQKIASIGEKDPLIIKEYEESNARLASLETQLLDIEATMQDIETWIADLTQEIAAQFQEQFSRIQTSFTSYFTQLFGGGQARLEQTEDGMDIIVVPPKKRPRHISLLSGGERTLTSLALIFAILDVQEPPFIVFDEVDAALDEANSKRFATLLTTRSKTTQSIVISHNRETMTAADVLYGVTMHADGTSHLYSVTLHDLQTASKETVQMQV